MKTSSEYDNFNRTMKKVLSVSKEELQRRLEAEKIAHKRSRTPKEKGSGGAKAPAFS
jgi:hypothetical protein